MNSKTALQTRATPSTTLSTQTREETLSLSSRIVSGDVSLVALEQEVSLTKALKGTTMRSAFRGNDAAAFGVAHILCKRFLDSFSFSTKLDPAQVETFTVDALEHFQYETLDDMVLFLKMARSGKFGTAKRGIDSNLVFGEWFPQYLELKSIEREKAVKAEQVAKTTTPLSLADVKKAYKQSFKKSKTERVRAYIEHITKEMDRQMLEDTIMDWSRDDKKKPFLPLLKAYRRKIK